MNGKKQFMPFNNQYPLSAWIYKVLNKADKEFTQMLHDLGYTTEEGKTFKLFTFSKLQFPKNTWKILPNSDRMEIWARQAWLTVSFHLPEQSEKFVIGIFKEQKAFIGDKISGVDLKVESIEALNSKIPDVEVVKIKAISPIVLGIDVEGKKNEQYVPPTQSDYKKVFLQNLVHKYQAAGKNDLDINSLDFRITKLYAKTGMQTIKAFTPAETKVKGYYFEFELKAPKEIIEIGINSGFGSMNSLGFGFGDVVGQD